MRCRNRRFGFGHIKQHFSEWQAWSLKFLTNSLAIGLCLILPEKRISQSRLGYRTIKNEGAPFFDMQTIEQLGSTQVRMILVFLKSNRRGAESTSQGPTYYKGRVRLRNENYNFNLDPARWCLNLFHFSARMSVLTLYFRRVFGP